MLSKPSPFASEHPRVALEMSCPPGMRVTYAEMTCGVSSAPIGVFKDWPQNVIDTIMFALERLNMKAKHTGGEYTLMTAEAGDDVGEGAYIKMVAYRFVPKVTVQ